MSCRTCHEIHTTYTSADWALKTTDPVALDYGDKVYDQGDGNLCANCHQTRHAFDEYVEDGIGSVTSTHWGPHHGPQAQVLLGIGGSTAGSQSVHYMLVEDGCPQCHLVDGNHLFSPSANRHTITACQTCHADASNFDIGGTQTEVKALLTELEGLLVEKGMLVVEEHDPWAEAKQTGITGDVEPVVGDYPEAETAALWNYILLQVEDSSNGVHNPSYTKALLQASIDALQ
jgi:hypothetical protein